jgi:osmotically-inducible protein OsmY
MNSESSSKLVIGVALAATFGAGFYFFVARGSHTHDTQIAQTAPAAPPPALPTAPVADTSATPPAAMTAPVTGPAANGAAPASSTPPAAAAAPAVAQNATTPSDNAGPAITTPKKKTSDHHVAKRSSDSFADTSGNGANKDPESASTAKPAATGTSDSANNMAANSPAPAMAAAAPTTDAPQAAPAPAAQDAPVAANAPATAQPAQPVASDSKISNDVKTEIATAAPNSNVNVSTTDGAVALSGSVPSQDAINQAKQAAQRVDGVKTVDTSGLLVNNQ